MSMVAGVARALLVVVGGVAGVAACGGAGARPDVPVAVNASASSVSPGAYRHRPPSLDPCAWTGLPDGCSENARGKEGAEARTHDFLAKDAAAEEPAAKAVKERSGLLPSGFYNPMPGGVFAGYRADTGLDIAGSPRPVYAIQSGTLDYSEPGHTLWTGPKDTANCVRFALDTPIAWKGRKITHVYYAHLSALEYHQAEGSKERRHIEGGELLGRSGIANHSPHLHIGLLLDGEVEQYWGTFLLEDEVRKVLGGYRNGTTLPREGVTLRPGAAGR